MAAFTKTKQFSKVAITETLFLQTPVPVRSPCTDILKLILGLLHVT